MDCINSKTQSSEIAYVKENNTAKITITRPESYNAYSTLTLKELISAFSDAAFDDSIAVIVLTGSGTRAFCTGGDVKEYSEIYTKQPHEYWKYMQLFRAYIESIIRSGKPTIARINGIAVGGGNESQLACDLSLIAEHAYIGQVGTSVGSVACGGATQWLPITVGAKRACEMLMLNSKINARKAFEWGLVNAVFPSVKHNGYFIDNPNSEEIELAQKREQGFEIDLSRLDEGVETFANNLKDKFPECMRYTKQQVNFWKEFAWHSTIGHGADWLSLHFACAEPYEGMRAFVEKRKPRYEEIRAKLAAGNSPEFLWGSNSKQCNSCKTFGIPEDFKFCGLCGTKI